MKAWIRIRCLYPMIGSNEQREFLSDRLMLDLPDTYIESVKEDFDREPPRVRNDGFDSYVKDALVNDLELEIESVEK